MILQCFLWFFSLDLFFHSDPDLMTFTLSTCNREMASFLNETQVAVLYFWKLPDLKSINLYWRRKNEIFHLQPVIHFIDLGFLAFLENCASFDLPISYSSEKEVFLLTSSRCILCAFLPLQCIFKINCTWQKHIYSIVQHPFFVVNSRLPSWRLWWWMC